jgi:hypothetical protein
LTQSFSRHYESKTRGIGGAHPGLKFDLRAGRFSPPHFWRKQMIRYGTWRFTLLASVALSILSIAPGAYSQTQAQETNPCEAETGDSLPSEGTVKLLALDRTGRPETAARPEATHGLMPADLDLIVYDANQGICWLADANMAGNPEIRGLLGVSGINPDGTMDYPTALLWVAALNCVDHGRGFLGHNNWQLPQTPKFDATDCSSKNGGTFGLLCSGSALGNLYNVGLNIRYPNSVAPHFTSTVAPFQNLQPALYWTSDSDSGGEVTFSFNTGLQGANTTKYNYFHVLPTTHEVLGTPEHGKGLVPYASGRGAGKAVYDTQTGLSWPVDANLAATEAFGVKGTAVMGPTVNKTYLTAPLIDADGAMLFTTVSGKNGWLTKMNADSYAGSDKWEIPAIEDLTTLRSHMAVAVGDTRIETHTTLGPFWNFQPGFYWACERDQKGNSQSPCDPTLYPSKNGAGDIYEYSFNFDDGFEGTDFSTKEFYVMIYYPAPSR